MESGIKTKKISIEGMTCANCQQKIERALRNTAGVKDANVRYDTGTAEVTFDADVVSMKNIVSVIEKMGYRVSAGNERHAQKAFHTAGTLLAIILPYLLLERFGVLNLLVPSQLADAGMGYGMLFIIGLFTSVHCIAMCGGINLSQCIPSGWPPAGKGGAMSALLPALQYNLGRVVSYTAIGFALGLAGLLFGGGFEAGMPVVLQGILKLIAGACMAVMGINMLGLFPWLRRLTPRLPNRIAQMAGAGKVHARAPFVVGLLNGLMPCGPLQSIQIVALASGNPLTGAASMLVFSLGTVPLMLGLGSLVSALGKRFTHAVLRAGAALVVVLGLAMLSQGASLSGIVSPALLTASVIALCVAGAVVSLPLRKPSHKALSAVAALGIAALAFLSLHQLGAPSGANAGISENASLSTAADIPAIADGATAEQQVVRSTLSPSRYPNITVQAGTPVKWIIDAPQGSVNGCNNRMILQEYGVEYSFRIGENIIEFIPEKAGKFTYSCWMGMIRATITVTPAESSEPIEASASAGAPTPTAAGEAAIATETTDENGDAIQEVTIALTDAGFSPVIAVVRAGLDVAWIINNQSSATAGGTKLLVPAYAAQVDLQPGENRLFFSPDIDFAFSAGDSAFSGYMKVADDIDAVDIEAVKAEALGAMAGQAEPFQATGVGSCCD